VFVRTRFFPDLDRILDGVKWDSFDALYEAATSLEEVNASIAEHLVGSTQESVLAVPGDGMLGEAVLEHLRAAGAKVQVIPGVPLGIGALAAADISCPDGAQMVEAAALGGVGIDLHIELNPCWPAVVTGVFNPRIASDLKLGLQRVYPAEHAVWLVRHPGLTDQHVERLPLAELDRARLELDHLTHVVLPAVTGYVPTGSEYGLRAIVARLRAPRIGCPWDLQQTHQTLIPYAIEEAYEVVDAIEAGDPAGLADDLGDLLLQVELHSEIADQSDEFD